MILLYLAKNIIMSFNRIPDNIILSRRMETNLFPDAFS